MNNKVKVDGPFFYRMKFYFIRGHQQWWYIPLMLANVFIVIYALGGTVMPWIWVIFPTIYIFALISVPLYVIVCILTGRWDLKHRKGAFKTEQEIWWEDNPLVDIIRGVVKEELNNISERIKRIEGKLFESDMRDEMIDSVDKLSKELE